MAKATTEPYPVPLLTGYNVHPKHHKLTSWGGKVKLWRWDNGRQNSGYEKFLMLGTKWPIPCDIYLLRFREGAEISSHTDSVTSGEHHRLNIIIRHARSGGEFICEKPIFENKRLKYFRPDLSEHSVSKVTEGTRYVLSIGWVKKSQQT